MFFWVHLWIPNFTKSISITKTAAAPATTAASGFRDMLGIAVGIVSRPGRNYAETFATTFGATTWMLGPGSWDEWLLNGVKCPQYMSLYKYVGEITQ